MRKSPGIATVLSFVFSGLGQIYNGQYGKGFLFILGQLISFFLMSVLIGFITSPIVWIWGMVDAYRTADRINYERDPEDESEREAVPVSHISGKKCRHCSKHLVYPLELKHGYCNRCMGVAGVSEKDEFLDGLALKQARETLDLDDEPGEPVHRVGKELELDVAEEKPMLLDEDEPLEKASQERIAPARQTSPGLKPNWIMKEQNGSDERRATVKKKSERSKKTATKGAPRKFATREEYEQWRTEQMRVAQEKHEGQA